MHTVTYMHTALNATVHSTARRKANRNGGTSGNPIQDIKRNWKAPALSEAV